MEFRDIDVEVRYRSGGSPSIHKVKLRPNETCKKIKRHITESLDIQGRLTYRDTNLDDCPNRRLTELYKEGEDKFCLITDKRPRDLKQHSVQLQLPTTEGGETRTETIKIARTTTIGNLKHKIQDECGISVDEHTIYVLSQQKECHPETNVMRLPQPLEVRLESSPASKPLAKKVQPSKVRGNPYSNPYDTKQSVYVSKRKGIETSIHPKKYTKTREKEIEEVQSDVTVSIQQAPYETIHQLGKNFEQLLKSDKSKKLVIEVEYKKEEEAKMSVKSKLLPNA